MFDVDFVKNVMQVWLGLNIIIALRLGYRYYLYSKGYSKSKVKQ